MRALHPDRYSFGEFILDLTRGCLTERGVEVRLRPKSFAVLRYLVENHGRLITKDELIEAVWPDTAVTDNSLVQCLKEVREVLGDKSQNYIKTVPRRGYIFNELNRLPTPDTVDNTQKVKDIRLVIDERNDRTVDSRRTYLHPLGQITAAISVAKKSFSCCSLSFS